MTNYSDQYFYFARFAQMNAAERKAERDEELRRGDAGKMSDEERRARMRGWALAGVYHEDCYLYFARFTRMNPSEAATEQKEEFRRLEAAEMGSAELLARMAGWKLAGSPDHGRELWYRAAEEVLQRSWAREEGHIH